MAEPEEISGTEITTPAVSEVATPVKEAVTSKPPKPKRLIPYDNVTIGQTAIKVSNMWATDTSITLKWITQVQFAQKVTSYNSILNQKDTTDAARSPISYELKEYDDNIDHHISFIKGYLIEKYGKNMAPSYYHQFGIVRVKKIYTLPHDRDQRVHSLDLLLAGIENEEFASMKYGTSFWTPIIIKYKELYNQTSDNIKALSLQVSTKNSLKKEIKSVLSSLILIIKANYPNTYTSVLREWGFQKELY